MRLLFGEMLEVLIMHDSLCPERLRTESILRRHKRRGLADIPINKLRFTRKSRNYRLFLALSFYSLVHCSKNCTTESLDVSLQVLAFKTLVHHRRHTGALYKAILPKNMSGMEASIVRIRSRRLWNRGINFSHIHIPSRTMTMPPARRVAIVYEDFGNWSSYYYAVPGYSLVTSVVGFVVYDVSNVDNVSFRKLHLGLTGKAISIHFPNLTFPNGLMSRSKCVAFTSNGTISLTDVSSSNTCLFEDQGRFSLIVPLEEKHRHRRLWIIAVVIGCVGLPVVGYIGMVLIKHLRTKKIQVMEKQADEDMVLETRWVGHSKMPSANVTRTQPGLEDGVLL